MNALFNIQFGSSNIPEACELLALNSVVQILRGRGSHRMLHPASLSLLGTALSVVPVNNFSVLDSRGRDDNFDLSISK
jgi:hypothetical protein